MVDIKYISNVKSFVKLYVIEQTKRGKLSEHSLYFVCNIRSLLCGIFLQTLDLTWNIFTWWWRNVLLRSPPYTEGVPVYQFPFRSWVWCLRTEFHETKLGVYLIETRLLSTKYLRLGIGRTGRVFVNGTPLVRLSISTESFWVLVRTFLLNHSNRDKRYRLCKNLWELSLYIITRHSTGTCFWLSLYLSMWNRVESHCWLIVTFYFLSTFMKYERYLGPQWELVPRCPLLSDGSFIRF